MNNDTNSEAFAIAARTIDVASSAGMYLAKHLTLEQLKYWQAHKKEMHATLRDAFKIPDDPFADMRLDWQAFCKKRYGWDVDFSHVVIPPQPSPAHRILFGVKGLTADKIYDAWPFPKWKYVSGCLDTVVLTNIRTSTNGHYAIWVLDRVEPDAKFLGKSTQVTDPEMKVGMTLAERLLLEDKYFDETGNHLDIIGGTFCSGSRDTDGDVPCVCFGTHGKVEVDWCHLSRSDPRTGVREAVSGSIST